MSLLKELQDKYDAIDKIKAEIAELEADFMEKPPENPESVGEILKRYGPAERLDHPSHITFVTAVTMNELTPDDELTAKLKPFFPMEGYIGRPGDCVLTGHVKFNPYEILVLNRYGITWKHACLGQAENLKNLEQK